MTSHCPLCEYGHTVIKERRSGLFRRKSHYYAYCPYCDLRSREYETAEEATKDWNARPREKELMQQVEDLSGRVRDLQSDLAVVNRAFSDACSDLFVGAERGDPLRQQRTKWRYIDRAQRALRAQFKEATHWIAIKGDEE